MSNRLCLVLVLFQFFTLFIITALALHRQSFLYIFYNYSPLMVQYCHLSLEINNMSFYNLQFLFLLIQSLVLIVWQFQSFQALSRYIFSPNVQKSWEKSSKNSRSLLGLIKTYFNCLFTKIAYFQLIGLLGPTR